MHCWPHKSNNTIQATLKQSERTINRSQKFTDTNNSSHSLRYRWLLIDQDFFLRDPLDLFVTQKHVAYTKSTGCTRSLGLDLRKTYQSVQI